MSTLLSISDFIQAHFDFSIPDKSLNGIQVENNHHIEQMISSVDFSMELLEKTTSSNNLFIVHHGLFWGEPWAIKGRYQKMLKQLFETNSALIAIHLPLDVHPLWGNNILLAKELSLSSIETVSSIGKHPLVIMGDRDPISYSSFTHSLSTKFNLLYEKQHGPMEVQKIGLCTGGGLFGLEDAHKKGCDTFITGDIHHIYYHLTKEIHCNLISLGHYNSETFGIKKLGEVLSNEFSIPHQFLNIPTGI